MNKILKIFFLISGMIWSTGFASNCERLLNVEGTIVKEESLNDDGTVNVTIKQPKFTPYAFLGAWSAFEEHFGVEICKITLLDENNVPYQPFGPNWAADEV